MARCRGSLTSPKESWALAIWRLLDRRGGTVPLVVWFENRRSRIPPQLNIWIEVELAKKLLIVINGTSWPALVSIFSDWDHAVERKGKDPSCRISGSREVSGEAKRYLIDVVQNVGRPMAPGEWINWRLTCRMSMPNVGSYHVATS